MKHSFPIELREHVLMIPFFIYTNESLTKTSMGPCHPTQNLRSVGKGDDYLQQLVRNKTVNMETNKNKIKRSYQPKIQIKNTVNRSNTMSRI
jgi:hypothetical protein